MQMYQLHLGLKIFVSQRQIEWIKGSGLCFLLAEYK
jgi:hypothetical protein